MNDLNAFQRDILYALTELNQPNGRLIGRALRDYYGGDISHGRLYPNLDDLADRGLIDKTRAEGSENTYSLTPDGRERLTERREWEHEVADGVIEWWDHEFAAPTD